MRKTVIYDSAQYYVDKSIPYVNDVPKSGKAQLTQKELQMRLYAYTTEIKQLKEVRDNSIAQIKDFESDKDKYSRKINELEEKICLLTICSI